MTVWVLGGYQTDFARNLTREGLDASRVEVVHVGNAFGELFAGQGHLGAMPATVCDDLWGVPATRHEAACASGSAAVLAAMADLRSGAYSSALVVGVELEKTVPGDTATRYLGAAAWIGHAGADAKYMWPCMFSEIADEYDRRYGLDDAYLRAIAELNFANARKNPSAQTRDWSVPNLAEPQDNPVIEGRLRRLDWSQGTDGGGGVGAGAGGA